jgi:hypothetical protein
MGVGHIMHIFLLTKSHMVSILKFELGGILVV